MKNLFLLILLYIFSSCSNSNKKVIEKYENGQIKEVHEYLLQDSTIYVKTCYYENGKIKSRGTKRDTITVGYWIYYYKKGHIKQHGNYIIDDSLNEGNWTYSYHIPKHDQQGNIIPEHKGWICSVTRNKREKLNLHVCRDGVWEFFHQNGQIKSKGTYKNGWSVGTWEKFAENGIKTEEMFFENKKRSGIWKYWYNNGDIKKIVDYNSDIEKLHSFWLDNGKQTLVEGTGTIFEINDDQDSIVTEYKNYLKDGRNFIYSFMTDIEEYVLDEENYYKMGKMHGVQKFYGNYGLTNKKRLSNTWNYVNDTLEGYSVGYYDGDTTSVSFFVNGMEQGIWKHFDENTKKLTMVEVWNKGKRHGIRKSFNYKTGIRELYEYFYEDNFIGEERFEEGILTKKRITNNNKHNFFTLKKRGW